MLEICKDNKNLKIIHYKFGNIIEVSDFKKYKNDILNEFKNRKKFYAINDLRNITKFDINYINYLLNLNSIFKNEELVNKYLGGTVLIVSKNLKNLFELIIKLSKTKIPNFQ